MSTQTSNSVFFTVYPIPPLAGSGWVVKARDHATYSLLAQVPDIVSVSVGPELNAAGEGSVTLDLDSPFWTTPLTSGQAARTLFDHEHVWEVYEDGALRFQFLGRKVEQTFADDTEARAVTVSGPGIADVLTWAVILRPGYPRKAPAGLDPNASTTTATNDPTSLTWRFPTKWPAMRMWYTLLKAAQDRGTVTMVTPLFTATIDSAGQAFEYFPTAETESGTGYAPTPGLNLLDFLNTCTGQDYTQWFAEWTEWQMWPGYKLDVRKVIGAHRENQVIFPEGLVQQVQRTRARDAIANYIVVVDAFGNTSAAADAASITTWGKRELLEDKNSNVTDSGRRNTLSQLYLAKNKDEKSEWVIVVPADMPGRRPFRDYGIGDWVGVSTLDENGASRVDAYRVLAMVVTVTDGYPAVELTLQTKLDALQIQLQKQITELIYRANAVNTTLPTSPINFDNGNVAGGTDTTTGGISNITVWIQPNDPGSQANPGDFWYDTDFIPDIGYSYVPDPSIGPVEVDTALLYHHG